MTSAACYGAMDKKSGLRETITAKNLFGDLRVAKHAFWGGRVNNMKNYKIAVAGTGDEDITGAIKKYHDN